MQPQSLVYVLMIEHRFLIFPNRSDLGVEIARARRPADSNPVCEAVRGVEQERRYPRREDPHRWQSGGSS